PVSLSHILTAIDEGTGYQRERGLSFARLNRTNRDGLVRSPTPSGVRMSSRRKLSILVASAAVLISGVTAGYYFTDDSTPRAAASRPVVDLTPTAPPIWPAAIGRQGNGRSDVPYLSGDGRFVAFTSS